MEAKNEGSGSSFPMGETPQEKGGFKHVPECYNYNEKVNAPSSMAAAGSEETDSSADIPVVDLEGIHDDTRRSLTIQQISKACKKSGFFQIVNHGIPQSVLDGAVASASKFFNLSTMEKKKFMSNDVHNPIRYGTSIKDGMDNVQQWRIFLKHYANPLDKYMLLWPENPHDYREKMSKYSKAAHELGVLLTEAMTEGLGLGPGYMSQKMEKETQTIVVNCYPPCPQPDLALGLSPHSDYSCLTIVLQNSSGLQIQDPGNGKWRDVPYIHGALQVNVGDCIEVLSNGLFKSVVHRVKLSSESTRISVASLHSLEMEEKMQTAKELLDDGGQGQHPNQKGYKESSFKDFLNFISQNDISEGKNFMDTLRPKT